MHLIDSDAIELGGEVLLEVGKSELAWERGHRTVGEIKDGSGDRQRKIVGYLRSVERAWVDWEERIRAPGLHAGRGSTRFLRPLCALSVTATARGREVRTRANGHR